MIDKMQWYVIIWDVNKNDIEYFNIFRSYYFSKGIEDLLKTKGLNRKKFTERVRSEATYAFWAKAEYEVLISDLFRNDGKVVKIDVFDQLRLNLNNLVDYIIKKSGYKLAKE